MLSLPSVDLKKSGAVSVNLLNPCQRWILVILMLSIPLAGCSGKNASHLPSVFELPGAAIGAVFENTRYKARRKKVSAFVKDNYVRLRKDADNGAGEVLEQAFSVAKVRADKRSQALDIMTNKDGMTFRNSVVVANRVTRLYSQLYPVKRADKKINGFTYPEINSLVLAFSQEDFEALRLSIKQGSGARLDALATMLKIQSSQERRQFNLKAQALYEAIYLEPVVVALMVSS